MSIVSVEQIGPGRTATAKLNGRREVRTHTQPYRVVTDNPNDTSYEIQAAFPPIGSPHIDDPYAYLVSKEPVADSKGKMLWIVPLVYSTERPRSENPCNDPTDIEWDTDTAMEPYLFDSDGQAMLNSAGDHYGEGAQGRECVLDGGLHQQPAPSPPGSTTTRTRSTTTTARSTAATSSPASAR